MGFVVLDSCVLYSSNLRSLFLYLSFEGLISPKWSVEIEEEWKRNLLKNRPELKEGKLNHTISLMRDAVPDVLVEKYGSLISGLELPDPDDRHVLAIALKSNAECIITFNLGDFPNSILSQYGINSIHPDDFLEELVSTYPSKVLSAFENMLVDFKNPKRTAFEVLGHFRKENMSKFSIAMEQVWVSKHGKN